MRNLILIIIVMFSASCMTEKKAGKRVAHLSVEYPSLLATFCAQQYPPFERTSTTIEYRQGKKDTIWQSEYVDCDTVIGENRIVKVAYPVIVPSRDTLVFRDSVFIENKAEISRLKIERDNYHAEAEKYQKRGKNLLLGGILVGAGIVFVMLVMLTKPF